MPTQIKLTQLAKDLEASGVPITPRRMQAGDAGLDLAACIRKPLLIPPNEVHKIPTGVHVWMGDGMEELSDKQAVYAGLLMPRGSLEGLALTNAVGLLDSAYQHELFVKVRNVTDKVISVDVGQRLVQLVIVPAMIPELEVVEAFDEETGRGAGEGSSGK